jgi:hypothetical protein
MTAEPALPRREAAQGRPAEPTADEQLEALATELLHRLGATRALLLASLIDEVVAEAAEAGA